MKFIKIIKNYLRNSPALQKIKETRILKRWLYSHPQLWNFNRQSVARGFGAGMFAGTLPVPIQMLLAAFLAVVVRGNIPVAVLTTFFSNPLTTLPIIYLIYKTGAFISGDKSFFNINNFSEFGFNWHHIQLLASALGKNFFIGLPIAAVGLAVLGYFLVYISWYVFISVKIWLRRLRLIQRKNS